MMRTRTTVAAVLLAALAGCKVGPNYQRPARCSRPVSGNSAGLAPAGRAPFAEMKWPSLQGRILQRLIKEALTNNYDVRIAASAIMQAEATWGLLVPTSFPPSLEPSIRTNAQVPTPGARPSIQQAYR